MDYGEHGDRVPGSQYYRAFCVRCKCPMRVSYGRLTNMMNWCEDCSPVTTVDKLATLTPRQAECLGRTRVG